MNVRLATVASARAAGPRASGGRSHMLPRLAAVALALLLIAICKPAHADTDGAVMYSTSDGGGYNAVVRDVTNRYDAALVCLGYSRDAVTDAQMEIKLSNEGSGGRFWEFAQTFFSDVAADNIPGWSPTWLYGSILANGWVYGDTFARSLWWTETTQELYNGALEDLQVVLRGGSLDSGGSAEGGTLIPRFYDTNDPTWGIGSTSDVLYGCQMPRFRAGQDVRKPALGLGYVVPDRCFEKLEQKLEQYNLSMSDMNMMVCVGPRNYYTQPQIKIYMMQSGTYTINYGTYTDSNGYLGEVGAEYTYVDSVTITDKFWYTTYTDDVSLDGTTITSNLTTAPSWNGLLRTSNEDIGGYYQLVGFTSGSGGDSGGGGGTNNWPDDDDGGTDDEPTEPVVPDPDPTPVPDPGPIDDPVLPDPDPIDNPSTGGGTTIVYAPPTDTTLIENWLSVIYDAITQGFNAVTTDMTTHCNHIQTKLNNLYEVMMSTLGKYLTNQTSSINNNLSNQTWWLARQIGEQFQDLKDYMHELAVWLAEQLDFSITDTGYGYDDTSVVAWLKKIYAKLGTGGGTSKPADPVEEPDNWWDWLLRALQNWVDGLGDVVGDLLGNLNDLLGGLLDKFPFGVPWMTLEVITLLAADPVTPVFAIDYTVFTIPVRYEVDLSPYDTAAATIRAMFYIVFGGFLLMKTPKVISEMMGVFE